jgi:hypothetical protein
VTGGHVIVKLIQSCEARFSKPEGQEALLPSFEVYIRDEVTPINKLIKGLMYVIYQVHSEVTNLFYVIWLFPVCTLLSNNNKAKYSRDFIYRY